MRISALTAAAVAALALAAPAAAQTARTATAALKAADGTDHGTLTFRQQGGSVRVSGRVQGVPAGKYAIHVHMVGQCEAPTFTSAGAHWNPTDAQHGAQAPGGPHKGDMRNITVRADGAGTVAATLTGVTLSGATLPMLDADGAAVILHATADDYRSQPGGDSGGRKACGVLTAS